MERQPDEKGHGTNDRGNDGGPPRPGPGMKCCGRSRVGAGRCQLRFTFARLPAPPDKDVPTARTGKEDLGDKWYVPVVE